MNTVEQRQRRNLPYVLAVVRCDNIVDLKMIRTFHDKTVGATTPRIREEFAKVFHPEPSKSLQSLMAPFAWLIFHSNKWLKTITRLCYEFPVAQQKSSDWRSSSSRSSASNHAVRVDNSPKWNCKVFPFSAWETLAFEWRRRRWRWHPCRWLALVRAKCERKKQQQQHQYRQHWCKPHVATKSGIFEWCGSVSTRELSHRTSNQTTLFQCVFVL